MKRLLFIGDAVCHTGFARVTHNILEHLCKEWEVHVIGVNYNGTPHEYPYPIWPARLYGDIWGLGTFNNLLPKIKPDVILAIQDPWIAARYATEIDRGDIPLAVYMPVDARNQRPDVCERLNALNLALFYTQFGEVQCRLAGYIGPSFIIPHGVDTELYRPLDKGACRSRLQIYQHNKQVGLPADAFIVGNVNRNQPRKRLDLSIQYFAEWIRRVAGCPQRIENAYLYLHCSQRDSVAWDLAQLANYYGVADRIILPDSEIVTAAKGLDESEMPYVYGCFDVQITTTEGEGWSLPTIEGMACGIPQIVPQYAALGEWAAGAAYMVPCSGYTTHPVINTVGALSEKESFIRALDMFYRNPRMRSKYSAMALARAREPRFQWKRIAELFAHYLRIVMESNDARIALREQKEEELCNHEIPEERELLATTA